MAKSEVAKSEVASIEAKILSVKTKIGKITKDGSSVVSKQGKTVQYATLTNILEKIIPILKEEKLDYLITCVINEQTLQLIPSNIRVFSLQFVDVETNEVSTPIMYPFHVANNVELIKADGSTITYATRYLLGLALGLQTEVDPDAKITPQQGPAQPTKPQPAKKIRTFDECKNGYYNCINSGNIDGAKKTIEFMKINFADRLPEIETMQNEL
jgi:hypothetical protein